MQYQKITKIFKCSRQNNLKKVTNENHKDISSKERLIIIDNLRLSIIMEYQKIINLLDNTQNQPTKFRTKKWVEINDDV